MSVPVALEHQRRLPAHQRVLALLAVGAARLLITLRPRQLRRVLELARHGARPATPQQAHAARQAVVAVSLRCAGQGCLQRSIAATLYCRAHSTWPTWCTGVRTNPFAAHSWIQVDGQPIGELHPAGHYRTLLVISAHPTTPAQSQAAGAAKPIAVNGNCPRPPPDAWQSQHQVIGIISETGCALYRRSRRGTVG